MKGLILSTCNRVEVLAQTKNGAVDLRGFLRDYFHLNPADYEPHLYEYRESEAVRHLFRVASSLDSMVVGEPQILGQVKEAYATARAVGAVHSQLDLLLTRAFAVAKRVRTETAVGSSAVSVASVAVELAKKIFGSLQGKHVYLVGAGKMSELAARHLIAHGAESIFVANRTYDRAQQLAAKFDGQAILFEQLYETCDRADIVITSTGAPHAIFRREHGELFLARRKNRPMFFIDIAVPRDVDPEMNKLDGIFVYDIDDLQQAVSSHVADRKKEAERAEAIITGEVERFQAAAADARCGAHHRLAAGPSGNHSPGRNRPGAGPPGAAFAGTGTGGRSAYSRHRQQDHAHADQHAEDGGARAGSHYGGRSGAAAVQSAGQRNEDRTKTKEDDRKREVRRRRLRSEKLVARLRIGSRGSQLALWQANHIKALLEQRGHNVEIEIIKTTGDKITDVALAQVGTKGMFTKEIEEALAENRVDLAVHSLKDLPTEIPAGFEIAAITTREDARDVFCSRKYNSIEELPNRARVGTSSLRRQAQLKALRPDLEIHPLRGNVDTRLRKLEAGEYDAVILAAAGLNRLGKRECIRQVLPAKLMCPAAGQGALAVEIRKDDSAVREHVVFLDDDAARATTTCERALLNKMGGGCQVPIGALAEVVNGRCILRRWSRVRMERKCCGNQAKETIRWSWARSVGEALLRRGGDAILQEVYGKAAAAPEQP